jgi:hypothetical protein
MRSRRADRRAIVLPLIVVSLLALLAFVALAIDLGILAVARTQCQDAADAAAMAGARALNGVTANNNNYSAADPAARSAAIGNSILSSPIQSSQVAVDIGRYTYSTSNTRFEGQFPGPSGENWSMARATITTNVGNNLPFARVFGFAGVNLQAIATAAHRPRDIALIVDFSGSMRFASLTGDPYTGNRSSNNADTVIPQFGHYSATSTAAMTATSFTSPYEQANITAATSDGRGAIVEDFYSDAIGTPAFTAAPTSYGTVPGGDNFLRSQNNNSSQSYAQTVNQLRSLSNTNNSHPKDTAFEGTGYETAAFNTGGAFQGYTQGPGYWGKTFFIWPPDPRPTKDWRILYFGTNDNSDLWNTSSPYNWRAPSGTTYAINYSAILNFIKNVGPNPFPSTLRSGRILYYDAIPNSITGTTPSNMNERFWKDYIDYVLGLIQTGANSWSVICDSDSGLTGYGMDYTWGTRRITALSSLTANPKPYMHYADNPPRPRTHFWFGPLTMIDFLGNYNLWTQVSPNYSRYCWWPGTCHESPMYACKLGLRAGLTDIANNHPNDLVSLIYFSTPSESSNDTGRFNRARVGLSRDYTRMQEALWYPPSTIGNSSATVRPYASDNLEVPRAAGGTCYAMGLMLAYNQFSGNAGLRTYNTAEPSGDAGGNGRKGAQKIVIFETDGSPNQSATASLVNQGSANSYYAIRYNSGNPGGSEYPNVGSSSVTTQINSLCTQLVALDSASPPGHSSTNKKALIHCIGFGPEFAPGGPNSTTNKATLNTMQTLGNVNDGMPDYKIIYGTESQITTKLQQALTQILQSGVQVSLIQ